jgi:hypothetical protein
MLEIENMYNRNKSNENAQPENVPQEKKDAYKESEKRKGIERRAAFQSMGEILSMKNDGGRLLPNADMSLIRSFKPESGKSNADALIRREISDCKDNLVTNTVQQDKVSRASNLAFLTCDLMNSLAATAEDLNTIYFYRLEDKIQRNISYVGLTTLFFNTAVHFEDCDLTVRGREFEYQYRCTGAWSGKSVYDWQNSHINIERIPIPQKN